MQIRRIIRSALAGLGVCLVALWAAGQESAEAPGQLRVDKDGVTLEIPDRAYVFKAGQQAKLFQIHDNNLIVFHEIEGVPQKLYAVFWSRSDAPAWVSNERMATFGRITPTIRGQLLLDRGEVLPIVAAGKRDYRVRVQRFGLATELDVPRDRAGLVWEPMAVATQTVRVAITNRPRIVIEGTGLNVSLHEAGATPTARVEQAGATAVIPAPPPPVVVAPPPPEVVPEVAPPAATSRVARVRAKPPVGPVSLDWPSPFREPLNQAIIGSFSLLIVLLILIRRRQSVHRKTPPRMMSPAARRTAVEGDVQAEREQPQQPLGERKLTLRSDRASTRSTTHAAEPRPAMARRRRPRTP